MRIGFIFPTLLLLCLICLISCNNDNTFIGGCDLDNPRDELPWLKTRIDSMASSDSPQIIYCYVVKGKYKNSTVFRFEDCNPVLAKVIFTLNCDGNPIESEDEFISIRDLKNPVIIWKPNDFACQVSF